jgi:hypothetical protein
MLHLNQVIAGLAEQPGATLHLVKPPVDPRFERPLSGLYWQIEGDGKRLRSRSLWDDVLALPDIPAGGVHTATIKGPGDASLLLVEREVVTSERAGALPLRVAVAIDRTDISRATDEFEGDLLPYVQVLAVLLLAASFVQIFVGLAAARDADRALVGHSRRQGGTAWERFPRRSPAADRRGGCTLAITRKPASQGA